MKILPLLKQRAAALIVVLSVILILAALAVAMTTAMRMERQAAGYYVEQARADLLVRQAVNYAQTALQHTIGTNSTNFWISAPGKIIYPTNLSLISGETTDTNHANLNRVSMTEQSVAAISGEINAPEAVRASWLYVRKNGQIVNTPGTATNNPIVGRFAFWVDDESSRINAGTARIRNAESMPSLANVDASSIFDPVDLEAAVPFLSPDDVVRADVNQITNRFNFTHYSHSPDLNPLGEPKIALTTSADRAVNTNAYLRISTNNSPNPALVSDIDPSELTATLDKLYRYFTNSDWQPIISGNRSYADKLNSSDPARVGQKAIDIIEYVRSIEAGMNTIEPIIWDADGGLIVSGSYDDLPASAFIGTARRPMISKLGVSMSVAPDSNLSYPGAFRMQVYFPQGYGYTNITGMETYYSAVAQLTYPGFTTNIDPVVYSGVNENMMVFESGVINFPTNSSGVRPDVVQVRAALLAAGKSGLNAIVDVSPIGGWDTNYVSLQFDATNNVRAAFASDPRLNKRVDQWVDDGTNVFNSNPYGTNASKLVFPSPQTQEVHSVAEIGYIASGVESFSADVVPWRSFRLAPTLDATNLPPDWLLLDLFHAPLANSSYWVEGTNGIARNLRGRINLNAQVYPYTNLGSTNVSERPYRVLRSLFTDVGVDTNLTISNIVNLRFDGSGFTNTNAFYSRGQLAELENFSTEDEEVVESFLRQVVDLTTVQSSVFRVYAVAQAIRQTPAANSPDYIIQAEQAVMALIERTPDGEFRVIHWRPIPL